MRRKKYYKIIDEFYEVEASEDIINAYPKVFRAMCKYWFKLNNRTIESMFDDLAYGNWKHLWETDEERKWKVDELCHKLQSEVSYCSDRMSWDRLIRIHWIWQRIIARVEGVY